MSDLLTHGVLVHGVGQPFQSKQLAVLVCPGFHEKALTDAFVRSLPPFIVTHIVHTYPLDSFAIFAAFKQFFTHQPVVAIGFSAGVVGLLGAAKLWQHQGGKVERLFAIDGWGAPSLGLPLCRMSHDAFTHWSSLPFGCEHVNFYADPSVSHLDIWENPSQVCGWQIDAGLAPFSAARKPMTAQDFLHRQLRKCQLQNC